jgi:hypothetical protein
MHGEVDVRVFFFGPDDLFRGLVPDRPHERHSDRIAQKMPEMHLNLRLVSAKSAEIHVL